MRTLDQVRVLATGLDHPEGLALGSNGLLYAGGEAGQVYEVDPVSATWEQIADTGGYALGVCLDAGGSIYVCDAAHRAVMRVDRRSGRVERWCESAAGETIATPNWGAFATDGSMWLTDSGSPAPADCNGRLLRVPAAGGDAEVVETEALHFPNGLCLGAGEQVHWLESFTPRLRRLEESGPVTVCELVGVVPDGVAADAHGGFVIGCYYPFRLLYAPPGATQARVLLDDPLGQEVVMPTNVCFCGEGLSELAFCNFGAYELKAVPAPAPGRPLNYPAASGSARA